MRIVFRLNLLEGYRMSINSISGKKSGHAQDIRALTVSTVVLFEDGAAGVVDQRSGAPDKHGYRLAATQTSGTEYFCCANRLAGRRAAGCIWI
jgi:L-aminopeptidase/D-esterase-like protein